MADTGLCTGRNAELSSRRGDRAPTRRALDPGRARRVDTLADGGPQAVGGGPGVAAINKGMVPAVGHTEWNVNIYNPIGTEQYFIDNIIPAMRKAVDLNLEVPASDAKRAERIAG